MSWNFRSESVHRLRMDICCEEGYGLHRVFLTDCRRQIKAVHTRMVSISQHEVVGSAFTIKTKRFIAIGSRFDFIATVRKSSRNSALDIACPRPACGSGLVLHDPTRPEPLRAPPACPPRSRTPPQSTRDRFPPARVPDNKAPPRPHCTCDTPIQRLQQQRSQQLLRRDRRASGVRVQLIERHR